MEPDNCIKFTSSCDLTATTIEIAMTRLAEMWPNRVSIRYIAYVNMGNAMYSLGVLKPYGVPIVINDGYDSDEWSLEALVLSTEKSVLWSPGA
ncbi:MAG: hypothetical protein J3T61_00255 [Candidatus Brocadiales bacterium]|nr:hypothetical protein [Candidatus Bathyanammoxibius sp.]